MSQQSRIIVLNGASSSGKTSTAKVLKVRMGPDCIVTGFDDILERIQPFGSQSTNALGRMRRNSRIMWFQINDGRLKLFKQLHREVVALSRTGHNVIVDTTYMDERALLDAAAQFAPHNAIFVGMKPPLEISEAWELTREDRPRGQARKHYNLVHAHNAYDLILDPSKMSLEDCAESIMRYIGQSTPNAFQQLATRGL